MWPSTTTTSVAFVLSFSFSMRLIIRDNGEPPAFTVARGACPLSAPPSLPPSADETARYLAQYFVRRLKVSTFRHRPHLPSCSFMADGRPCPQAFNPSEKRPFVIGLPTGSSPLATYKHLIEMYRAGEVSFKVSSPSLRQHVARPSRPSRSLSLMRAAPRSLLTRS